MIKNIDHIGIAVKSLDEALPLYTDTLKLELEGIETVESQGVKVAFILAGNTRLELLEALSPESPIAKFIEKRGEGIHHVALGVEHIEDRIKEIKESGIRMIDDTSRKGAHHADVAFVHPKSTAGVLYELCERAESKEEQK
ncbi:MULTISPECIES: methylmalonyl-CoA epimerase [unclassified Peribacillus]|uniref:methylmalonyl-CoA epimerase n=1 Tax=unclassified Peribacillus TaxID=2675266 RepID=UPI001913740B|nr:MULTISPECIES: methylmalonyl-CoA epimerase [unclassified Peribacillus]MBK5442468.1 methylmalonyl-CoA epimerase [Peribacillus sp. TH24]MBK5462784.1 methylmalonyl-CoA epimerase [Peribacillus sp. TH27]MBK5483877.1 methylmalonyl-CoA epimerase [Peribacillus sp. TH16]MBK5500965.1 methylmalonyl-CoA epimerase [Peribacillus sp. TH14]WMX54057.1 methylmalonyl-CoA epimerase [Peribacillus sp. R9-11]